MKHIKQFEALSVEPTLKTKKYSKYYEYLMKKYSAHNVLFYEWKGMLNIVFKYARILEKENIEKFITDFKQYEYRFTQDNKAIRFEVFLPEEYIQELEMELSAQKYNI